MAPAWCEHCGRPAAECDGSCRRPLDPPRFCPSCGRPRRVQVTPTGYTARPCAAGHDGPEGGQLRGA